MADIKFVVSVDAEKGTATMARFTAEVKKSGDAGAGAGAQHATAAGKVSGLWKEMAIGQMVAQGVNKTFRAMKDFLGDSVKAATEAEDSQNALKAALEITGRSVEGNTEAYNDFAAAMMKETVYSDEAVRSAATLMLQLTDLDQKGVQRAIKGAAGLATTMGIDLNSATRMVTKAMEGQTTALRRAGIIVDENLPKEQKQAKMMEELDKLYARSTAEVKSMGGQLKQVGNYFDEVKEGVGGAIVGNEDFRKMVKSLSEGLIKFVDSDKFKLWLSALTEVIGSVIKFLGGLGKAVVDVENKLFGAKGWDDYVATQERVNGIIQEGINVQTLRRKVIDQDIMTGQEWAKALKGVGYSHAELVKQIKEGKFGEVAQAAFTELKTGTVAAKAAMDGAKPVINETGNALKAAAEKASALKGELKLVFATEVRDEIAQVEEAMRLFQGQLSPKSAGELKTKLDDLRASLKGNETEAEAVERTFKEVGIRTIPEMAQQAGILFAAMRRLDEEFKAGKVDVNEYKVKTKLLNDKLSDTAVLVTTQLPKSTRNLQAIWNASMGSMNLTTGAFTTKARIDFVALGEKWGVTMGKIKANWDLVSGQMNAVFQQAQTNKEIGIENEYKKRLDYINKTVTDEDAKAKAITALEAEFEIRRTSARRAGAKQQKVFGIMSAIINTAEAFTKALTAGPIIGPILAGLIAAMGAVQISLIRSQPIPMAKGGVFMRPTQMLSSTGQSFEFGEGGEAEILSPESKMRQVFRSELSAGARGGMKTDVRVYIGEREIEDFVVRTVNKNLKARRILVPGESLI